MIHKSAGVGGRAVITDILDVFSFSIKRSKGKGRNGAKVQILDFCVHMNRKG